MTENEKKIEHGSGVLFMGSCFTENISKFLQLGKLNIQVNPFGILYNPLSICRGLSRILANKAYTPEDLDQAGDRWISFDHHGSFAGRDPDVVLRNINQKLGEAAAFLSSCRFLFITLGTSCAYFRTSNGKVAANCHKIPESEFRRRMLSVNEIVDVFSNTFEALFRMNPGLSVVFTVSPVRHWRDGAHGNNLSKSILLLSVDRLVERFAACSYFPSYEILLDELRDYRFYAEDMLHPGDQAVDYIFKRFEAAYLHPDTAAPMAAAMEIERGMQHRPLDSADPAYATFLQSLLEKMDKAGESFPFLDFSSEQAEVQARLQALHPDEPAPIAEEDSPQDVDRDSPQES